MTQLFETTTLTGAPTSEPTGDELYQLVCRLYPLHRSLCGLGTRQTLDVLSELLPLDIRQVASGTQVFDWRVPDEWHVRDAWIGDADGQRVVDYRRSNLHVLAHSRAVRRRMRWSELREHVYTLPEYPDWIPYRTAYYQDRWGFCLTHRQFLELERRPDAELEVVIDATLQPGYLNYAECFLPGESDSEILVSTHICHPSLANDNLSGIAVATYWARWLAERPRRHGYRFVFVPATLGPLVWLRDNLPGLHRIRQVLVLALLGDPGPLTYKRSRDGNAPLDAVMEHLLFHGTARGTMRPFTPLGYDERQYAAPGFGLPTSCLMRTPPGEYPQYHSSADDLTLVCREALLDSLQVCRQFSRVLDSDRTCRNLQPFGEPQLGRRGLVSSHGTREANESLRAALLWTLNLADGRGTLLDIARRSGLPFFQIQEAAELLGRHALLELRDVPDRPSNRWTGPGRGVTGLRGGVTG